jgi:hypothetical protein
VQYPFRALHVINSASLSVSYPGLDQVGIINNDQVGVSQGLVINQTRWELVNKRLVHILHLVRQPSHGVVVASAQ